MNNHIIVSRGTQWGNPYKLGEECSSCGELHLENGSTFYCYKAYVEEQLAADPAWLEPLAGKYLICSGCPPTAKTCHARVLEKFISGELP